MMKHFVCAFLSFALGCSAHAPSARPPAAEARPAAAVPAAAPPEFIRGEPEDGIQVSGALGELDAGALEERLRERLPEINRCYQDVHARLWYLSGRLELKLRVGQGGQVRSAAVSDSSLGNYDIERCVAAVAQKLVFPPPRGGEAEFTYPVEFPVRAGVRHWPEERVAPQMQRHRRELFSCKAGQKKSGSGQGPRGPMRLTLYIGPGGRVASAGLSADEPIDDRVGLCLVSRVQAFRFDDPLGQMVKATYAID